MSDSSVAANAQNPPQTAQDILAENNIRITRIQTSPDYVTIFGLFFALGLIVGAIMMGNSNANFIDVPSIMIVILGTIAATCVSYSWDEIAKAGRIIGQSLFMNKIKPAIMAKQLMDIAVLARKKGVFALSIMERELSKNAMIADAMRILADGYNGDDAERVLTQDLDSLMERHRRSANMLRRAAEIAPAMGLIGTLVGLVQMLANLDNPEAIGPAMALALLTTFYGAIMSTIVLNPMAAKLERNSNDEAMLRTLVMMTVLSIARQENPRRLEMLLNSELPPEERIVYFD
jgi:chemotaxis protein MotA